MGLTRGGSGPAVEFLRDIVTWLEKSELPAPTGDAPPTTATYACECGFRCADPEVLGQPWTCPGCGKAIAAQPTDTLETLRQERDEAQKRLEIVRAQYAAEMEDRRIAEATIERLTKERDGFATLAEQNRATAFERGELLDAQPSTIAKMLTALERVVELCPKLQHHGGIADEDEWTAEHRFLVIKLGNTAREALAESSPDPVAFDHAAECEKLRGVRDKIQIENNDLRAECERLRAQLATQEEGHIQNFADATRRNLELQAECERLRGELADVRIAIAQRAPWCPPEKYAGATPGEETR